MTLTLLLSWESHNSPQALSSGWREGRRETFVALLPSPLLLWVRGTGAPWVSGVGVGLVWCAIPQKMDVEGKGGRDLLWSSRAAVFQ